MITRLDTREMQRELSRLANGGNIIIRAEPLKSRKKANNLLGIQAIIECLNKLSKRLRKLNPFRSPSQD